MPGSAPARRRNAGSLDWTWSYSPSPWPFLGILAKSLDFAGLLQDLPHGRYRHCVRRLELHALQVRVVAVKLHGDLLEVRRRHPQGQCHRQGESQG